MRPADALRHEMEMGSTGSLTVHLQERADISIYLMQGEILAAEAEDDGPQLVRRLVNGGFVTAELGQTLLARLSNTSQVGDVLFGTVPDDVVMELYGRRFRQNLVDFVLSEGDCEFAIKEDIHVENVQVGHDSYELLEELDQLIASIGPLLPPADPCLLTGDEPPTSALQNQLLEALPPQGTLQDLVDGSPRESAETLCEVLALLEQGSLRLESDEPVVVEEPTEALEAGDDVVVAADDSDDEAVEAGEEVVLAADDPEDDLEIGDESQYDDAPEEAAFPVVEDLEPGDAPVVDEHDMAMFADHDTHRGRGGDGIFTVSQDLLDTVDLSGVSLLGPDVYDEEELLEMEDGDDVEAAGGAVSLRFGSPPLSSEEAITKIEVTNEVLRQLSVALDDEHGSGSGQAAVQLLVESSGTDFAALFVGVDACREGAMDTQRILLNIDKRPEGERRRLLNRAMRDMVERGFTMAVERISEERFEALLERIAGYQHRLGL